MKLISILCSLGLAAVGSCQNCAVANVSALALTGVDVGRYQNVSGTNMYITGNESSQYAIVYLTDVFGIQLLENRLLADSFGRAGYLVVAPDMFNGTPSMADIDVETRYTDQFLATNDANQTDAIVAQAIGFIKTFPNVTRIGATGYCFGGRFSFRAGAKGFGAEVVFAAHPANLVDEEISAVSGPASVAAAENDTFMPVPRRAEVQTLLQNTTLPYQFALYGGTSHGFGVRVNLTDPVQKFGKEGAFFQAVRWFDYWLKQEM